MHGWLNTLNSFSGLLQAIAAIAVTLLTVELIRWNKKYVHITEQAVSAALQQARILQEQWNHAREPRILIRVPPFRDPLRLEVINVGESTFVIERAFIEVPVTPMSTSAINLFLAPTVVLAKNAFHELDLDSPLRDFISHRNIPANTFQSLVEVTVACKTWEKQVVVSMWLLAMMHQGHIVMSRGRNDLGTGRDIRDFHLYEQHVAGSMEMPVPMPLGPGIH